MICVSSHKARGGVPRVTKAGEVKYLVEGGLPRYGSGRCNVGRVGVGEIEGIE